MYFTTIFVKKKETGPRLACASRFSLDTLPLPPMQVRVPPVEFRGPITKAMNKIKSFLCKQEERDLSGARQTGVYRPGCPLH